MTSPTPPPPAGHVTDGDTGPARAISAPGAADAAFYGAGDISAPRMTEELVTGSGKWLVGWYWKCRIGGLGCGRCIK